MTRYLVTLATAALLSSVSAAWAQQSYFTQNQLTALRNNNSTSGFTANRLQANIYNRAVPRYNFTAVNRGLFNNSLGGGLRVQKPFSGARGGQSVTPYLALSEPFTSSATNYYTQVRPLLEQQRLNQQQQQRNAMLQRQLTAMAARPPYDPTGSQTMAPTGHVAAYMNYGGYYTPVQPVKR
jgi:hypothetical protein